VHELEAFCEEFAAIHKLYRERSVPAAMEALEAYQIRWPTDKPAEILMQRCRTVIDSPARPWSPRERLDFK